MSSDPTKCWYCGGESLVKIETWWKCSSCGASTVQLPPLNTKQLFTRKRDLGSGGFTYSPGPGAIYRRPKINKGRKQSDGKS